MILGYDLYPLLFIVSLAAGTIDTIAGGGGIIVTPALLLVGMPPILALGTGKLQSAFCTFSATKNFYKHRKISLLYPSFFIFIIFLSGMCGTYLLSNVDQSSIKKLIPIVLLCVFIYSFFSKKLYNKTESKQKLSRKKFFLIFSIPFGIYDGFLGSGIAYMWTLSQIYFLGFNLKSATAYSKLYNLCGNLGGLLIFIYLGEIDYKIGLLMGIGQFIGGKIGSDLVMTKGVGFVRNVFLISSFCMICVLFYKYYFNTENINHVKSLITFTFRHHI